MSELPRKAASENHSSSTGSEAGTTVGGAVGSGVGVGVGGTGVGVAVLSGVCRASVGWRSEVGVDALSSGDSAPLGEASWVSESTGGLSAVLQEPTITRANNTTRTIKKVSAYFKIPDFIDYHQRTPTQLRAPCPFPEIKKSYGSHSPNKIIIRTSAALCKSYFTRKRHFSTWC
ncbi:MAG: hypothetical protein E7444_08310 [Ruminococcaceae bacterium]|nr:hypothetical protein [Oscillospiraceae bacterium]